jgi:hypothetical protein
VWSWSTETRAVPDLPGLEPVSLSGPLYTIPSYNSILPPSLFVCRLKNVSVRETWFSRDKYLGTERVDALFSLLIIVLAVHSWPAPTLNPDPKTFDYCGCGSLATCVCTKHQQLHFRGHSDFHDSPSLFKQAVQPIRTLSISLTEARPLE